MVVSYLYQPAVAYSCCLNTSQQKKSIGNNTGLVSIAGSLGGGGGLRYFITNYITYKHIISAHRYALSILLIVYRCDEVNKQFLVPRHT